MKVINAGFPLHLISRSTFNKQNVVDDRRGGDAVPCTAFIFTNYRCSIIRKLTLLMVVCVLRLSGWPQSAGSWVCSILGNCKGIPSFLSFSTPLPCVLKCRLFLKCTHHFHEKLGGGVMFLIPCPLELCLRTGELVRNLLIYRYPRLAMLLCSKSFIHWL
jgi:hypothetical protein